VKRRRKHRCVIDQKKQTLFEDRRDFNRSSNQHCLFEELIYRSNFLAQPTKPHQQWACPVTYEEKRSPWLAQIFNHQKGISIFARRN
jgi:hypothetical protein